MENQAQAPHETLADFHACESPLPPPPPPRRGGGGEGVFFNDDWDDAFMIHWQRKIVFVSMPYFIDNSLSQTNYIQNPLDDCKV